VEGRCVRAAALGLTAGSFLTTQESIGVGTGCLDAARPGAVLRFAAVAVLPDRLPAKKRPGRPWEL